MLYRSGAEFFSQCGEDGFPGFAFVRKNADFDQPVGIQGRVHFFLNGRREPVVADQDEGVQMVCISTFGAALGRRENKCRHPSIIKPV